MFTKPGSKHLVMSFQIESVGEIIFFNSNENNLKRCTYPVPSKNSNKGVISSGIARVEEPLHPLKRKESQTTPPRMQTGIRCSAWPLTCKTGQHRSRSSARDSQQLKVSSCRHDVSFIIFIRYDYLLGPATIYQANSYSHHSWQS